MTLTPRLHGFMKTTWWPSPFRSITTFCILLTRLQSLVYHWTTAWTLNLALLAYVIVPLGKLIHLKGLQNTWRLIDDYQYTKVLSKAIYHTVHWLGSFVEGKIAISLKNYKNVPFALFLLTFQRVMKFCVKGQTLCLFHFIVFVSWA